MEDNIANYYLLPLLGLGKASFKKDNLINTYLCSDQRIAVEVMDKTLIPESIFIDNPLYDGDFEGLTTTFIIYRVPEDFLPDVLKFAQGKYSEMSVKAKEHIIKYSGLSYNEPRMDLPKRSNGQYQMQTSKYILALSKDPALKQNIERILHVKLPPEAELISKPSMNNFYPLQENNNNLKLEAHE